MAFAAASPQAWQLSWAHLGAGAHVSEAPGAPHPLPPLGRLALLALALPAVLAAVVALLAGGFLVAEAVLPAVVVVALGAVGAAALPLAVGAVVDVVGALRAGRVGWDGMGWVAGWPWPAGRPWRQAGKCMCGQLSIRGCILPSTLPSTQPTTYFGALAALQQPARLAGLAPAGKGARQPR
jgi:hypothetical protein